MPPKDVLVFLTISGLLVDLFVEFLLLIASPSYYRELAFSDVSSLNIFNYNFIYLRIKL